MKPGILGIHHVGLSVPDLSAARDFYVRALGFVVVDEGHFGESAVLDAITGLEGARCDMVLLSLGNLYLEIFQFHSPLPEPGQGPRSVNLHGYTHLTFEVEDIEKVYRDLMEAGVTWHCPPTEIAEGYVTTYGRDPFGNVLEIQQVVATKPYALGRLPLLRGAQ